MQDEGNHDAIDAAETGRVGTALGRLGPALDEFVRFGDRDHAVRDRAAWQHVLDGPLPVDGVGLDEVLAQLGVAIQNGCRVGHPGFSGFIVTAPTTAPASAATAAITAGTQRYLQHAFNGLEWTGLRWLAELCGIPADWQGVFCSGGSTANLLALGAARQWAFEQRGVDVGASGTHGGPRARIYASTEVHRTIHRSAAVLGLGRDSVRAVPVDHRQRLDVSALDAAIRRDIQDGFIPMAVVAVAGTTNTGAIDPISEAIEVARHHGAWVHVDGAYGLVAAVDPDVAARLKAVADADSAIVNPHKWLATGFGISAVYVRHADAMFRTFQEGEAAYLEGSFGAPSDAAASQFDEMGGPWADLSVELSSATRGAMVWAVLREIGVNGVRDRVRRHRGYAVHVAKRAREHPRLEALIEPELSVACFRYRSGSTDLDALNRRILERLRRETDSVPSSTEVQGNLAIRPCFINPRTSLADVDALIDAVIRLGDEETSHGLPGRVD